MGKEKGEQDTRDQISVRVSSYRLKHMETIEVFHVVSGNGKQSIHIVHYCMGIH